MRYFYFLLMFVVLSGCAHNRIRYIKVDKKDREAVAQIDKNENREPYTLRKKPVVISPETSEPQTEPVLVEETQNEARATFEISIPTDGDKTFGFEEKAGNKTINDEDEPSTSFKVNAALQAEEDARKARTSMIWAVALLFAVIIPFASFASIIPFIIGSIKLRQSNRSNYITPEGERFARSAKVLQIIYGVVMILSLILLTALIILIFF